MQRAAADKVVLLAVKSISIAGCASQMAGQAATMSAISAATPSMLSVTCARQ